MRFHFKISSLIEASPSDFLVDDRCRNVAGKIVMMQRAPIGQMLIVFIKRIIGARASLKVSKRPILTMRLHAITDSVFGKPDNRYDCAYHSGKTSWYFRGACVIPSSILTLANGHGIRAVIV